MIPALAFHVLTIFQKADQLQTTEIEGGEGVANTGLKEKNGITPTEYMRENYICRI